MNKLPAETYAQIAMLAPTSAAYRGAQLAHAKFDHDPRKQFWVRNRFRTWLEKPSPTDQYRQRWQILPSGRHDGYSITFYDNSIHVRGYCINGLYHGNYTSWYETGALEERFTHRHGQRHGEYTFWDCSGAIQTHCMYEFGKRHGEYLIRNFRVVSVSDLAAIKNNHTRS